MARRYEELPVKLASWETFRRRAAVPRPIGGGLQTAGEARHWSLYGDMATQRDWWRLCAFAALALAGGIFVAYVGVASRSRITPYVVEVDRHGLAVAWGPAKEVSTVADRVVMAEVQRFIANVRVIYRDPLAQKNALDDAYAHIPARDLYAGVRTFLTAYLSDPLHDPRILASRFQRAVEILSVLRIPAQNEKTGSSTWKVQWDEWRYENADNGRAGDSERWEAIVSVKSDPPKTLDEIRRNPAGVYITQLGWSRLSGASDHKP
jgi:type IV secretory pathway TrbF-like protein